AGIWRSSSPWHRSSALLRPACWLVPSFLAALLVPFVGRGDGDARSTVAKELVRCARRRHGRVGCTPCAGEPSVARTCTDVIVPTSSDGRLHGACGMTKR